ncbi:PREDICTED: uncharacterized protein LOC107069864 isoform X2 [Polistes dominula]|nr:PREDICTED: uncharacterized protein LOC107069864 isoform X2 [Polistes dominula]
MSDSSNITNNKSIEDTQNITNNDISEEETDSKEDFDVTDNSLLNRSSFNNIEQISTSSPNPKEKKRSYTEDNKNNGGSSSFLYIFIFSMIICIIAISYYKYSPNHNDQLTPIKKQNSNKDIIQEFRKSVDSVKSKFHNQTSKMWIEFQSQVEEVVDEKSKTSIVLLLGNETNTIKCFAHLFGSLSSKVLGSNNYLLLNARNIGNDHGEILTKWKPEIVKNKVVIIEDLLSLETESIKSLHNLCDTNNPLVSKSFYIITIISNGYEGLHTNKFVEGRLTDKYSKTIDLDILDPLITRITDGPIISIFPESNMKEKHNIKECSFL